MRNSTTPDGGVPVADVSRSARRPSASASSALNCSVVPRPMPAIWLSVSMGASASGGTAIDVSGTRPVNAPESSAGAVPRGWPVTGSSSSNGLLNSSSVMNIDSV
ncbi:MAG TPA: hypothetical protein VG868_07010 [Casimicrobiaceae bacterium]|nr:hypothetical protein [Casimicrobiaceae bacterium]